MTDLEMIQSPMEWPRWPFLPVKHRTRQIFSGDLHGNGGIGLLLAVETPPFVVYHANMYAVALSGKKTLREAVEGLARETYDTAQACVADWKVD